MFKRLVIDDVYSTLHSIYRINPILRDRVQRAPGGLHKIEFMRQAKLKAVAISKCERMSTDAECVGAPILA